MSELPTPFQIYHLWCRELWHFHTQPGGGGCRAGSRFLAIPHTQPLSARGVCEGWRVCQAGLDIHSGRMLFTIISAAWINAVSVMWLDCIAEMNLPSAPTASNTSAASFVCLFWAYRAKRRTICFLCPHTFADTKPITKLSLKWSHLLTMMRSEPFR